MFLLFGGCDSGGDRLSELVPAFALQREDLNEAKQLIRALAATEGDLPGQIRSRVNVRLDRNQGGQGHAQETVYARGDYSTSADG